MSKRFGIQFEGFTELMENLDKLGGDLKSVGEDCLKIAFDTVTPNIKADMSKHHRTGQTEKSITTNAKVEWQGETASVNVGFNLLNGGMPSIYLMHGTPRMKKDTKLYNDFYGTRVKKEISQKQEKILQKAIAKRMGD